jgi:hypothetical protein
VAQVPHQHPDGEKDRHEQAEYDNVDGEKLKCEHYSLIASCLRKNVEPFAYLRDLLTRLPALSPRASRDDLRSLVLDRWLPS